MTAYRALLLLAGASAAWCQPVWAQDASSDPAQAGDTAKPDDRGAGDDYHNQIIVTANGLKRLDFLAGTSVMSGEDLQRNLAGQVGDVLAKLPGVSATSFSPGASRPVLRGFQGDRVRVLVDGIGSIDASNTSADHAVTIDPLTADRIEVLRGPAVLLYGSSAIGGAVNVIDKRIPRKVGDEPIHFDGIAGVDSATDLRQLGGSIDSPLGEHWAFHFDGSWRKTSDVDIAGYQIAAPLRAQLLAKADTLPAAEAADLRAAAENKGTLPNSATETKSYGAGLSWIGERANLGVSVGRYETEYGVPTLPGDEADVSIGMRQTRYDLRGALDLGGFFEQVRTRWGWSDYTHTEFQAGTPGTRFDVKGMEGRVELTQADRGGWRGSLGAQYMKRDLSVTGDEAFLPANRTEQWSLFGLQEIERGPFTAQFGGRYEDTSVTAPAYSRTYGTVSGAASLAYDTGGGLRLGVNATRTERAPTAEELLADGPHPATQQYEIGDPALRTESAWGVEGYARGRVGPAQVELALYRNWFTDFVYLAANGAVQDNLPVYVQKQANADWYGAELDASMPLYESDAFKVVGDLNASYIRATLANGDPVPRIPPLSLTGGLEYQSDAFDVRGEVEWADRQDRIASYETATPGYTTANLSVAWKPIRGNDNVTVMLKGDNLFDVTRRVHASFTKDFVPLPGRNIGLSVKVSL